MITATISTYNREKYLPGVLESLARQSLDSKLFEIVLVDNNSPGNTKEIFDEFAKSNPQLRCYYHLETNQGLSFGRNRGIKESKGEYITFIDDDAFLADDYLEKIHEFFNQNQMVAAIGSKILLHYESVIPNWENRFLNSLLGYFNLGDEQKIFTKNDYPRGSNMSFRKSVFEKVGLFNVNLGRIGAGMGGSEEKDIFKRIYNFPELKVVYIPDALVYHCVPIERTTTEFIRKQALGTGSSERIRVKNEGVGATVKRYGQEFFKWGASIILFIGYLFLLKPAKGIMLIRFRYWVSSKLFFK